jgi:ribosomal protein S21
MSKHGPRVRVSIDDLSPSARRQPKHEVDKLLRKVFKRACEDYGVLQIYKEKEFFISKGEKKRKRKLRAKIARLKGTNEEQQPLNKFKEWETEW